MGPLLFLLYINDLKHCLKNKGTLNLVVDFVLYADDTNVFISCNSLQEFISAGNKVLESINLYMLRNLLHINLDKSYYMHFSPPKNINLVGNSIPDTALYIGNVKIKEVDEIKFLGVIIDKKLSWDAHITKLQKKLKAMIAVICRISPYIQPENYKALYHTLFESHLTYCISAWGGVSSHKTDVLFRIQKKCLRVLYGDREAYINKFCTAARTRPYGEQRLSSAFYEREHTKPFFNKNGIMNFRNLYTYMTSNEFLKIMKYQQPTVLSNELKISNRNNKTLILLPNKPNPDFLYNGSLIWNRAIKILEVPTIHEISVGVFKAGLKKELHKRQQKGDSCIWTNENMSF